MKLKVYNKKVIYFVWENMMTLCFVAELGKLGRLAPINSEIIFSHTKSVTYMIIFTNTHRLFIERIMAAASNFTKVT
jgi:hypothetical protein